MLGGIFIAFVVNETLKHMRSFRDNLQDKLSALLGEADVLKRDIEALTQMILRYEGQPHLDLEVVSGKLPGQEFMDVGLKKAVLTILRKNRPVGLRVAQIYKMLIAGGYRSNSPNLKGGIFAVLSVLNKDGVVEKPKPGLYRAVERLGPKIELG